MRHRIAALTLGFAALAAGCTTATGTPATAPTVPETLAPTTTTPPPTTTVTLATTTTVDRLTEIQALYQDLEDRRVRALWSGNREAFVLLFVDNPYREESLRALDLVDPGEPPKLIVEIVEVIKDDSGCLVFVESTIVVGSNDPPTQSTVTLQRLVGGWGFSYVSSDPGGWLCIEPHPLSG